MTQEDNIISAYERHAEGVRKNIETNKTVVFDALAAAHVTSVTVEFDGEGDSGGIEHISANCGDASIDLPAINVSCHRVGFGDDAPVPTEQTLRDAVEDLCYDCLARHNDGWENNDGAFGIFAFDVANRTINLEFNGRYSDVFTRTYEF